MGYTGLQCDVCDHGYFGYPKCRRCNCHLAGTDSTTGNCDKSGICQCNDEGHCPCKVRITFTWKVPFPMVQKWPAALILVIPRFHRKFSMCTKLEIKIVLFFTQTTKSKQYPNWGGNLIINIILFARSSLLQSFLSLPHLFLNHQFLSFILKGLPSTWVLCSGDTFVAVVHFTVTVHLLYGRHS